MFYRRSRDRRGSRRSRSRDRDRDRSDRDRSDRDRDRDRERDRSDRDRDRGNESSSSSALPRKKTNFLREFPFDRAPERWSDFAGVNAASADFRHLLAEIEDKFGRKDGDAKEVRVFINYIT